MVPQMGTAWGQLAGAVCLTMTYRERDTHLIRRSMNKTPGGLSVDKLPKKPHDMLVPSGDMGFVANSDPGAILSMEI